MKLDAQKIYVLIIGLVVIVGGYGVYYLVHGSKNSAQDTASQASNNNSSGNGNFGGNGGGRGRGQFGGANSERLSGTIKSKSDSQLVLTTTSGDITVGLSSSTRYNSAGSGQDSNGRPNFTQLSLSDLTIGETVTAMGTKDASGTIQANIVFVGDMPQFQRPQGSSNSQDQSGSGNST